MRCQFLREAQVKWCRAGPVRKQIVRRSGTGLHERCTSGEWMTCPTSRMLHEECPSLTHCPFLQETLAQYCSAAGISKFIPFNEITPSRCTTENHSYCQVFLASTAQHPSSHRMHQTALPQRKKLLFTPNHMWMHVGDGGNLHIGVDALLAAIAGKSNGVSFKTSSSYCYPAASFSFGDANVTLTFPVRIHQTGTNSSLVSDLTLLTSHPYSRGWLFEGVFEHQKNDDGSLAGEGLMSQQYAERWIADERSSMEQYVRDELVVMGATKVLTLMDGGTLRNDWVSFLSKKKLAALFYEFFSPSLFLPPFRERFSA